jgi:LacI family transcriptional regulator
MDYWPNGAARSLITHRTHTLGVLLPELYGEFFSEVVRGIDLAARRERYQVLVSSSHADIEALVSAVRSMRGRIDGLIAMAPDAASITAIQGFTRNFPITLLDPGKAVEGCESISIDNYTGALDMVRHLAKLGHRVIAMLKGPAGNLDADERLSGYRAALKESGLAASPDLEFEGDFSEASGYRAASELMLRQPRPTAVFAANDYMAIGLIGALRDSPLRVPQDMAVTGFDDIPISQYLTPPLTTVRVNAYELGERAVQRLLPRLQVLRPSASPPEILATRLIIRSSCGSPRTGEGDGWRRHDRSRPASAPLSGKAG